MSFDVRGYLFAELPRLLSLARTPTLPGGAVIQMVIVDRSDCDCAYRVGEGGVTVSEAPADDVDLTVSFISADLEAFSERRLDMARAIRTKRVQVIGDASIVAWMADRLAVAATGWERVK